MTKRIGWTELREELGVSADHRAYAAARTAFERDAEERGRPVRFAWPQNDASRVAMLTGLSVERLDELGGVPDSE